MPRGGRKVRAFFSGVYRRSGAAKVVALVKSKVHPEPARRDVSGDPLSRLYPIGGLMTVTESGFARVPLFEGPPTVGAALPIAPAPQPAPAPEDATDCIGAATTEELPAPAALLPAAPAQEPAAVPAAVPEDSTASIRAAPIKGPIEQESAETLISGSTTDLHGAVPAVHDAAVGVHGGRIEEITQSKDLAQNASAIANPDETRSFAHTSTKLEPLMEELSLAMREFADQAAVQAPAEAGVPVADETLESGHDFSFAESMELQFSPVLYEERPRKALGELDGELTQQLEEHESFVLLEKTADVAWVRASQARGEQELDLEVDASDASDVQARAEAGMQAHVEVKNCAASPFVQAVTEAGAHGALDTDPHLKLMVSDWDAQLNVFRHNLNPFALLEQAAAGGARPGRMEQRPMGPPKRPIEKRSEGQGLKRWAAKVDQ